MIDISTIEKHRRRRVTDAFLYMIIMLVCIDIVTTTVGVGWMGATEYNPLAHIIGFGGFMLAKVILSVICVYVLHKYCIPSCPMLAIAGMGSLIGLYSVTCASNVYQLARQVL